jgi:L-threonylcarbamoyladenylate synthase
MVDSAPSPIQRAAEILRQGGLVAFPTETVYGLGADATNANAVQRIFAAKGRPADHPLIVHLADGTQVERWARELSAPARRLADAFWPGPLTLIVQRAPGVLDAVTGGQDTVGLRVPRHPVALELLRCFGGGVAAPSANRFGRVSPTCAQHVKSELGDRVELILEGGACDVGLESTIVDCSSPEPVILRPGAITREMIEAELGQDAPERATGDVRAPGLLPSHYAPRAQVLLATRDEAARGARAASAEGRRAGVLSSEPVAVPPEVVQLEFPCELEEAARLLYARLREADERALDVLFVVPPPEVGVGRAIADRLRRAAAPRPE